MKTLAIANHQALFGAALKTCIEQESGYTVCLEAQSGRDLISKLENLSTLPDLCIIDVFLRQQNGYETMLALKTRFPLLKTLVITAANHPVALMLMIQNGANGYLVTDCGADQLTKVIDEVCDGVAYFPESLHRELSAMLKKNNVRKGVSIFSEREYSILELCGLNYTCKEIASRLNIGERTTETYFQRIFTKLNIKSRLELLQCVQLIGLGAQC